jgi:DNA-binding HxlR family transcriptional regulator
MCYTNHMVRKDDMKEQYSKECEWREVIGLIGDKWSVLILHAMCHEKLRYSEVHRRVPGISQKVLTATLRQLERDGVVKRTVYPVVPPRVEYQLTPLGHSVFEVIESLREWSINHLTEVKKARETYDLALAK